MEVVEFELDELDVLLDGMIVARLDEDEPEIYGVRGAARRGHADPVAASGAGAGGRDRASVSRAAPCVFGAPVEALVVVDVERGGSGGL